MEIDPRMSTNVVFHSDYSFTVFYRRQIKKSKNSRRSIKHQIALHRWREHVFNAYALPVAVLCVWFGATVGIDILRDFQIISCLVVSGVCDGHMVSSMCRSLFSSFFLFQTQLILTSSIMFFLADPKLIGCCYHLESMAKKNLNFFNNSKIKWIFKFIDRDWDISVFNGGDGGGPIHCCFECVECVRFVCVTLETSEKTTSAYGYDSQCSYLLRWCLYVNPACVMRVPVELAACT